MFNLFRIFKNYEIYDESSDCFDAMKDALKRYEEQFPHDLYIYRMKKEQKEKEIEEQEAKLSGHNNDNRYTLDYLYKRKL